jgi:hypothetical protein
MTSWASATCFFTHTRKSAGLNVCGGYGVRFSVANTTEWGTDRRTALELLEDALSRRKHWISMTVCRGS